MPICRVDNPASCSRKISRTWRIVVRSAGIPLSLQKEQTVDAPTEAQTRPITALAPREIVETVGDIISESRATSSRNAGRGFVGIVGDITPEFAEK